MAFLTKEELKTVADVAIINKITDLDDSIVEDIIDESIWIMKSYLSRFYDADAIFDTEGAKRNLHILKKLKDIAIYEIYERHTRDTNAVAERRYNIAMHWLEKINTGEQGDGTLPSKPDEPEEIPGTNGDTRFGGNTRYTSKY